MKLVFSLLVGGAVLAVFLLRRSRQAPPTAGAASALETAYGLTLEGPATAHLPAAGDDLADPYPATLIAHVSLPSALWPAVRERLWLIVTGPNGWRSENTFSALDQPLGMNIDPHFETPIPTPRITQEELTKHVGGGNDVESTFRANVALLGLPSGRGTYQAKAVLDDLHSNELSIDFTVEAAPRKAP